MNDKGTKIQDLKKKRTHYQNKALYFGIELVFVFGVPAVAAALIGKRLDLVNSSGRTITIALLITAFVLSWMIVIFRYKKLTRDIKGVDTEIENEREQRREQGLLKPLE